MENVQQSEERIWPKNLALLALLGGSVLVLSGCSVKHQTPESVAQPTADVNQEVPSMTTKNNEVNPENLQKVEQFIPPVIYRVDTTDPVVFLTIDDGAYKDESVIKALEKNNIKASLFLAKSFINSDPHFFDEILDDGSKVENHTLTHDLRMIKHMDFDQQKSEICGMADYEKITYNQQPILFRPPGGAYNDTMLKAAGECGVKVVVNWSAEVKSGSMMYSTDYKKLRPGDIVLMHFRKEFKQDLKAFIKAKDAAGLDTALLEDYLMP